MSQSYGSRSKRILNVSNKKSIIYALIIFNCKWSLRVCLISSINISTIVDFANSKISINICRRYWDISPSWTNHSRSDRYWRFNCSIIQFNSIWSCSCSQNLKLILRTSIDSSKNYCFFGYISNWFNKGISINNNIRPIPEANRLMSTFK